jgi:hypothetical protein
VDSRGSRDAARRLVAARSEWWGVARRLVAARSERWAATVSRRLAAASRERWGTTVSRRAASVIPRGCRVGSGDGDTTSDY